MGVRSGSNLKSHQVKLGHRRFQLMNMLAYRLYVLLYQIADRHHTDKAILFEHWHVAESAFRHPLHDAAERIVHVASGNVACHHLRDW